MLFKDVTLNDILTTYIRVANNKDRLLELGHISLTSTQILASIFTLMGVKKEDILYAELIQIFLAFLKRKSLKHLFQNDKVRFGLGLM